MSVRSTELKIYQKSDSLYDYCEPIIKTFPPYEKFGLSLAINNAFITLLSAIIQANEILHKRKMLQNEIDGHLSVLIVLFNRARKKKYITEQKNYQLQERVAEVGRMLGGWKKSVK